MNVKSFQGGQKTATEIAAAYQPFDNKVDQYEYCVLDFLEELFKLVGIEDNPTFKRSRIVNQLEETQMILTAAQYLDDETIDEHTLLLLHGDDLTDSSPCGLSITNDDVSVSDAQSKFGGKSLYFNGSTSALTIKSDVFNFGSGNFTVDWWEYCTGNSATRFALSINGGCGGICAGGSGDGNKLYIGSTGTSWNLQNGTSAFSVTKNQWVHWAVVRYGTKIKTYRNGSLYYSGKMSGGIYWNGAGFVVGSFLYDSSHYFEGYIDEFRVSDIARWTSTFTPPKSPYSKPVPSKPNNLTALVNDGVVSLSWSASSGATGYRLSRDGVQISDQTGTTYTETLAKNQSYTYSLVAYNDDGDSNPATLTVTVPLEPPAAPTGLSSSVSQGVVSLSWDASANATGYRLYRDGTLLADQTGTGYTDNIGSAGEYAYTLIAYNDDGDSPEATLTVTVVLPPSVPAELRMTARTRTAISLAWDAVSGAEGYRLYRDGVQIYSGTVSSYTDTGLSTETPYTYAVEAYNSAGTSSRITLETATTGLILITDRTQQDVDRIRELAKKLNAGTATVEELAEWNSIALKGSYDYTDLNRVGDAVQYLSEILKSRGYERTDHQASRKSSVRQIYHHAGPDRCFRLYVRGRENQPGLYDHLRGHHCVLLRHSEPEGAGRG